MLVRQVLHVGPGARVVGLRRGHEAAPLHVEHMDLAVLDHVVPAMQGQGAGLHPFAHHRVVHQPLELQHHRALLGAAQRLGAGLGHRQRGLAPKLQPLARRFFAAAGTSPYSARMAPQWLWPQTTMRCTFRFSTANSIAAAVPWKP